MSAASSIRDGGGLPPVESINGTVFRRRLIEHIARVEASADRAGLALDLGDVQALDGAVTDIVRSARLVETAFLRLLNYEGTFGPIGER